MSSGKDDCISETIYEKRRRSLLDMVEPAGRQWNDIRESADAAQGKYELICRKKMSKLKVA